ncbi:MAG: hypothetical protein ACP5GI_04275 [Sulfolobales archaeon]
MVRNPPTCIRAFPLIRGSGPTPATRAGVGEPSQPKTIDTTLIIKTINNLKT